MREGCRLHRRLRSAFDDLATAMHNGNTDGRAELVETAALAEAVAAARAAVSGGAGFGPDAVDRQQKLSRGEALLALREALQAGRWRDVAAALARAHAAGLRTPEVDVSILLGAVHITLLPAATMRTSLRRSRQ